MSESVTENTILDLSADSAIIQAWLALKNSKKINGWYIHPRIVSYTSLKRKRNEIAAIKRNSTLSDEYLEHQIADFERPCTIQTAFTKIIKKGTIYFMSGPIHDAHKIRSEKLGPDFHSFVLIYYNNIVVLMDPEYSNADRVEKLDKNGEKILMRFTKIGGGLGVAIPLMRMIKNKYKVEQWWMGKGTDLAASDGTNCNNLTQDIILNVLKIDEKREVDWAALGFEELTC
jgi:hypothetical protein